MELKYSIATIFLLFLLLDLPRFSSCDSLSPSSSSPLKGTDAKLWVPGLLAGDPGKVKGEAKYPSEEEVYQIDYRGPETHPVLPFPPRGRPRRFHPVHPNSKPPPQTKDSKVSTIYNITIMESITFPLGIPNGIHRMRAKNWWKREWISDLPNNQSQTASSWINIEFMYANID